MWFKLIFLIIFSSIVILYGVNWYKRGLSADEQYDFREDFKDTFLTLHWRYSSWLHDDKPRRIAPVMMILGGIGILVVGLIKLL